MYRPPALSSNHEEPEHIFLPILTSLDVAVPAADCTRLVDVKLKDGLATEG